MSNVAETLMNTRLQSPLNQVGITQHGVNSDQLTMYEAAFLGYVNLRGDAANPAFILAVEQSLGGGLPIKPNTCVSHGELTVLWLGPDEWLIVTPQDRQTILVPALKATLQEFCCAVTDVTGGNTVIDIRGSAARDLLAKGSTIDFHPSRFSVGQSAQSLMAKTAVIFYQYDVAPAYRLVVRRSFADYLGLWLLNAAKEFVVK